MQLQTTVIIPVISYVSEKIVNNHKTEEMSVTIRESQNTYCIRFTNIVQILKTKILNCTARLKSKIKTTASKNLQN